MIFFRSSNYVAAIHSLAGFTHVSFEIHHQYFPSLSSPYLYIEIIAFIVIVKHSSSSSYSSSSSCQLFKVWRDLHMFPLTFTAGIFLPLSPSLSSPYIQHRNHHIHCLIHCHCHIHRRRHVSYSKSGGIYTCFL